MSLSTSWNNHEVVKTFKGANRVDRAKSVGDKEIESDESNDINRRETGESRNSQYAKPEFFI